MEEIIFIAIFETNAQSVKNFELKFFFIIFILYDNKFLEIIHFFPLMCEIGILIWYLSNYCSLRKSKNITRIYEILFIFV